MPNFAPCPSCLHACARSFHPAQFEASRQRFSRPQTARSPRSCTWLKRRPRPCGAPPPAPSRRRSRRPGRPPWRRPRPPWSCSSERQRRRKQRSRRRRRSPRRPPPQRDRHHRPAPPVDALPAPPSRTSLHASSSLAPRQPPPARRRSGFNHPAAGSPGPRACGAPSASSTQRQPRPSAGAQEAGGSSPRGNPAGSEPDSTRQSVFSACSATSSVIRLRASPSLTACARTR